MPYTHRTVWDIAPYAPKEFFGAPDQLPPLVAQVLWARGMTDAELASLRADASVETVEVQPPSLEDIFIAYMQENEPYSSRSA